MSRSCLDLACNNIGRPGIFARAEAYLSRIRWSNKHSRDYLVPILGVCTPFSVHSRPDPAEYDYPMRRYTSVSGIRWRAVLKNDSVTCQRTMHVSSVKRDKEYSAGIEWLPARLVGEIFSRQFIFPGMGGAGTLCEWELVIGTSYNQWDGDTYGMSHDLCLRSRRWYVWGWKWLKLCQFGHAHREVCAYLFLVKHAKLRAHCSAGQRSDTSGASPSCRKTVRRPLPPLKRDNPRPFHSSAI